MYKATNNQLASFDAGDSGTYIIDYMQPTHTSQELISRIEIPEDVAKLWAKNVDKPFSINKEFICVSNDGISAQFVYSHHLHF